MIKTQKNNSTSYPTKLKKITSSNIVFVKRFITRYGKLISRSSTRLTAKQYRKVKKSIKQARVLKLMPITIE